MVKNSSNGQQKELTIAINRILKSTQDAHVNALEQLCDVLSQRRELQVPILIGAVGTRKVNSIFLNPHSRNLLRKSTKLPELRLYPKKGVPLGTYFIGSGGEDPIYLEKIFYIPDGKSYLCVKTNETFNSDTHTTVAFLGHGRMKQKEVLSKLNILEVLGKVAEYASLPKKDRKSKFYYI